MRGGLLVVMAAAARLPSGVRRIDKWRISGITILEGRDEWLANRMEAEDWGAIDGKYVLVDCTAPAL